MRSAPADKVQGYLAFGPRFKIGVSGTDAEMRQVDQSHRVRGADADHCSGSQAKKAFAGPQDRKGAEKPLAVDFHIPVCHAPGVAVWPACGKVTAVPRGCDAGPA